MGGGVVLRTMLHSFLVLFAGVVGIRCFIAPFTHIRVMSLVCLFLAFVLLLFVLLFVLRFCVAFVLLLFVLRLCCVCAAFVCVCARLCAFVCDRLRLFGAFALRFVHDTLRDIRPTADEGQTVAIVPLFCAVQYRSLPVILQCTVKT